MITQGDKVAARTTFTGTHTGEFMGIPPTGKTFSIGTMKYPSEYTTGQITDNWNQFDTYGLLQQLGLIPPQQ